MPPRNKKADDEDKPVGEMTKLELVALITNSLKPAMETITSLKTLVEDLRADIDKLTDDLKTKEDEIDKLKTRLEDMDQYSRRNNLRIFGVPEAKTEDTNNIVIETAHKVGVAITKDQIDRSHRLGKPGDKPRPIIVKFVGYGPRRALFLAKKALKGSKWTIREDLTQERLAVLKRAIESYSYEKVWSIDGVILVNVGAARPMRVKCNRDLDSLLQRHPPDQINPRSIE